MYIHARGNFQQDVSDALPDLKTIVVDAIGHPVRRISRFMQLALIGAGRCARGQSLPKDTAVYLASGRGDLEITIDVMNQVFRDGSAPKPLSFVNTVSNSAAFYIAKSLQLESRSCFVCNRYFAFEIALQLALADLATGSITSALIGAVDSVVAPLHAHRARLQLDAETTLAEASHWIWLSSAQKFGALPQVHFFSERDAVDTWLGSQAFDRENTFISAGQTLERADFESLKSQHDFKLEFSYRQSLGYYDSQSAAVFDAFSNAQGGTLVHINSDPLGRYCVMTLRRETL